MGTPDARDVLEKFIAALNECGDGTIRDVSELAHPKDVIKSVLQQCIKAIEAADQRSFLRSAYLSLGNYQELSEAERKALSAFRDVGPPGPPGSELLEEQTRRIGDFAVPLRALMVRLKEETAILAQELKSLPGAD
jgi:hypothetical protein